MLEISCISIRELSRYYLVSAIYGSAVLPVYTAMHYCVRIPPPSVCTVYTCSVLCGWAGIAYQCTVYIDVYKPYLPRCVHDVII